MQPELPPSALRLDIDKQALADNWRTLNSLSGTAAAAAAVKADAYGLGASLVVPILRDAGCADFFVAHFGELSDIAGLVDPSRISVLHGPIDGQDVAYAKAIGAKPVINSLHQARLWLDGGGGLCDLMIDTGMNRLGVLLDQLGEDVLRSLDIDVLVSHLASAEDDIPFNEVQRNRWDQARRVIAHRRASLANSAGIMLGAAYHGDLTRPGLALYGGIPRLDMKSSIRQVVRPMTALLQTRSIGAGEGVGYNSTYVTERTMRVGTVALGYADGYLRSWSSKGHLIGPGGERLPVLGRVSMDLTIVDLSDVSDLREGDWLEIGYDLSEASAVSGLSQYELLTGLGSRFRRNAA